MGVAVEGRGGAGVDGGAGVQINVEAVRSVRIDVKAARTTMQQLGWGDVEAEALSVANMAS
jgi:hypothetical protein